MQKLGLGLSLVAAVLFSACNGDSTTNPPNNNRNQNKDATVSSSTADGGTDAGIVDTGPAGPCNPVDGSGCTMGQLCSFVINLPDGLCQDPAAMPKQLDAPCDVNLRDCDRGMICLQLAGDPMATCRKVCNNGVDADCAGLGGGMGTQFNCAGLTNPNTMMTAAFGYCRGSTVCEPWNDMCPMGQKCQQVASDAVGCGMEGTGTKGMPCTGPGGCVKNTICVNLGGAGGICYEACNATGGTCTDMNQRCGGLMNQMGGPLPYGICQDRPMGCNPADDQCPAGQACAFISNTEVGCITEGTNGTDQPCGGAMGGCMRGHACVDTGGGATCKIACDANNPCAMMAMCNMGLGASFTFGICP